MMEMRYREFDENGNYVDSDKCFNFDE